MIGRSVVSRLIAVALVVATCSIVATAWVTTRSTTVQIQGDLKRSLEVDNDIFDQLIEYGRSHPSWDGVQTLIDGLATSSGRIIAVRLSDGGQLVASSDAQSSATRPDNGSAGGVGAAALLDPLAPIATDFLEPTIATKLMATELPTAAYHLDADELAARQSALTNAMDCGKKAGAAPQLVAGAYGQTVQFANGSDRIYTACSAEQLDRPGRRFVAINNVVVDDTIRCLGAKGVTVTDSGADDHTGMRYLSPVGIDDKDLLTQCRDQARRTALQPYVAPQALLYLDTKQQPSPGWLKSAGGTRTMLALLAVLLVTIVLAVLGSGRILRPIRSLTRAAQRMADGDLRARVRVRGADEVARLGSTFNTMATSLERNEAQRKQLVSDVAHELRNPLANVRGYLEGAQDDVVRVDKVFVDSLLEETMLLQHLIDDLQDLALAEAGRLRVHTDVADLHALAEQTVAAHRQQADRAGVSLRLAGTEGAYAEVDQMRMRQVLGNLVANALRYTPPNGTVEVRVGRATGDPQHVRVEVVDSGVGIDPEHLPHLFDRFYRVDASRSRETGGSGLGLAITQYLVQAHGGTIEVESEIGVGTAFTIELPAAASPRPAAPPKPVTKSPAVAAET